MRRVPPLLLLATLAACGGHGALDAARTSLASSERVVTDLDERVGRGPAALGGDAAAHVHDVAHDAGWLALVHAVADARTRLAEAEQSLDAWERDDSGDMAWRTIAPCLAAALDRIAGALHGVGARDDADLEEAAVQMHAETVDQCAQRDE
jgi:hypothetical protein